MAEDANPHRAETPLPLLRVWTMCVGLFGVQIVWGLHNVSTSRIFQTFGANVDELAFLWIAAPATGLIVQPLIGYLSDRTWGRLGRRRPYMLLGAVCSAAALIVMPRVESLWAASVMLWLLIASINIVMEPFRALAADSLPERQRTLGFSVQVFFIGTGAVFASALPWLLYHGFGVAVDAHPGAIPPVVQVAFQVGAAALLATVVWTVLTTPERSPEALAAASPAPEPRDAPGAATLASWRRWGFLWVAIGIAIAALALSDFGTRELHVLAGTAAVFGLLLLAVVRRRARESDGRGGTLLEIVEDIARMPRALRQLAVVQFFTWFGLFAMWIYTVPAVAEQHYGATDAASLGYGLAADDVSLLFAAYNGIAAIAALSLPWIAARTGRRSAYAACLLAGAAGLAALAMPGTPAPLWLPAIGIGIAWAAILSLPYAILADALPASMRGVYMGIHNIFMVLPQLVAASLLGTLVAHFFEGQAAPVLLLAGASLAVAAVAALRLPASTQKLAQQV